MSLFTRGTLTRNWGVHATGITVPPANAWNPGPIVRGRSVGLTLPPATIAMDPSDRRTWTRPVRWT